MTPPRPARVQPRAEDDHQIHCRLDELLAEREMTLTAICEALDCEVGDLLVRLP